MTDQDTVQNQPPKTPAVAPAETGSSEAPTHKYKVLIVEDDPLIVKMYNAKFLHEGFTVLTAEDGMTGLELALKEVPDFMVLDIMMPRLSGIDLLEKLRTDTNGKNIPVLVLTNLSEKDEQQRALELGAKEYLLKANLTPGEVVMKIKKYLGE